MTITQKQKELLEKELKGIPVSYGIGFSVSLLVSGLFYFLVFRSLSGVSLFGIEEYLTGFWALIWCILIFLLVFLKWIKGNNLTERKREIELKLAEEVVGSTQN